MAVYVAYMSVWSISSNCNESDPSGATQHRSRPMSGPSHSKGNSYHMQSKQDIYIHTWAISNYTADV